MPAIRLVMSGGSGKGVLECAGALNAVFDRGNTIAVGAGNSAGGIVLGALASGKSPKEIREIALTTNFSKFISAGFWGWLRAIRTGNLSDGKDLLKFLEGITGGKTFKDAGFDLRLVGANYTHGELSTFSKDLSPDMPLALGMRITSAIPLGFSAVEWQGKWYKDGGVYAHVPVEAARTPEPTVIFALAHAHAGTPERVNWAADVGLLKEIERTVDLLIDANVHSQLEKAPPDAIKVFSDALGFGTFKFDFSDSEKQALYKHGYDLMAEALRIAGL